MSIAMDRVLPADLLDAAWGLYNRAFDELRTTAVQRHLMHHDEFDAVMFDDRVWTLRGVDPADPAAVPALAIFTNDLATMPLISIDYFAHRWPDLYVERRIWYNAFFAIEPEHRGSGLFEEVIGHMWRLVMDSDGIALLDICRRNAALGLPTAIHNALIALTDGTTATAIDEQTYWMYAPPGKS